MKKVFALLLLLSAIQLHASQEPTGSDNSGGDSTTTTDDYSDCPWDPPPALRENIDFTHILSY